MDKLEWMHKRQMTLPATKITIENELLKCRPDKMDVHMLRWLPSKLGIFNISDKYLYGCFRTWVKYKYWNTYGSEEVNNILLNMRKELLE